MKKTLCSSNNGTKRSIIIANPECFLMAETNTIGNYLKYQFLSIFYKVD